MDCFHIFPIHGGFRSQIPPYTVTKSDRNRLSTLCSGRRYALPAMRQTRQSSWTNPSGHVYTGFSQRGSQVGSLARKATLAQIPTQLYQQNCGMSSQLVATKADKLFALSWGIPAAGNFRKKNPKKPKPKPQTKNKPTHTAPFQSSKCRSTATARQPPAVLSSAESLTGFKSSSRFW